MTELPIEKTMLLSKVEGRVFILRVDGTLEYGKVGSELHLGDLLLGGGEAIFQLTEETFLATEAHLGDKVSNVIGSIAADAFDNGALDVLRKLIADGGDPTELFSPSASGTNTVTEIRTTKDLGSSQGDFVVIQRANGSTIADASFDTQYRNNADNNTPAPVAKSGVFYGRFIDDSNDSNSNEDIPPSFKVPGIHLIEDAFTNGTAVVGESSFVVKHNNAPLSVESLVFSNQSQTLLLLNSVVLCSDGHPLKFEFADDRTLLGYYFDGNGQRVEVLRGELVAEQEGSDVVGRVVIALTGPLDHQGSDSLLLGLQVSASEIDGDTTSASLTLTINDGNDPYLGLDNGKSLQEGSNQSLEGQLPVTMGGDRLVSLSFEVSQPTLAGLTSQGLPTSYEVQGNQLIVKDWQGKAILHVIIGLDGKYSVSLTGDFDEPSATNSLDLVLNVEGRDADGDKSNLGALNITITDGTLPQIDPVSLILAEDSDWLQVQTLSGSLVVTPNSDPLSNITFDANQSGLQGLSSGQQRVAITVTEHLIEGRTPNGELVFELTLGNDGKYSFILHQALDQSRVDSQLKAGFTLIDSDGNKVSSSMTIAVSDGDNPTLSAITGATVAEIVQGEVAAVSSASFLVTHGSDALDPSSLSFDIVTIQRVLSGLSSHGSEVSFSLEPNGHLTGVSADGRLILRAELGMVVDTNGNWQVTTQVTLSGELDHVGGEQLSLPLAITFSDMDGDQSSFSVPFHIADGALPEVIAGSGVFFSEDGLSPVAPRTATGSFIVQVGSDRLTEVSFADSALQPALSAQGKPIQYELADDDPALPGSQLLKGYVMIDGQRVEVFEIQLIGNLDQMGQNQFSYLCTLYTGVDQGASRVLSLPLVVNIRDYDHGGNSITGILDIAIAGDELPIVNMSLETLTEGRFDGVSGSSDDQIVKGALTISTVADPVVQVQLFMSGELVNQDYTPLTHNGEIITWQVVGTTGHLFQGVTASGVVVVTVELLNVPSRIESNTTQTLEYQVTLHTNVDHISGFDNATRVPISVEVRDSDGNAWVRNSYINILDGRDPVISSVESVTVNEAALDGGAGQHPGTHAVDTGEIATGQIMMAAGSDRVASIEIDVAEFNKINVFSSTPPDGFRAGGVKLVALAEPGHYMGFADTFPAGPNGSQIGPSYPRPLFYVKLDVTGHYTFTLVGSLSHTSSDGGNGEQLTIKLPLFATDHDGDRSAINVVNVIVLDDAPLGTNVVHTLVEGDAQISSSLLPFLGADGTMAGRGMIATKLTINNVNYGFGVEIAVPSSDGGQVMGTLVVNRDGSYRFTPSSSLTHNDSQVIKVRLLDGDQDAVDTMITLNVQDKQGLLLGHHSILALADTQIPLPLDASVMNGMPGELSLRVDGLKGAEVVDVSGNSIGHEIVGGEWLLPIDHSIPLYVNGLGDGAQKLTLYMESSVDSYVQASANDELDIYVGGMKEISGTQGNELLLGDNYGNVLKGGAGDDLLIGGGGSDLFLWSQEDDGEVNAPAHDIIKDFNIFEDDIIDVADLLSGVKGASVDELLNFVDMKISDADGGLKNINVAISPLGDGKITQQISLSNVDISMFAGSSESEILKALVDVQNLRFI